MLTSPQNLLDLKENLAQKGEEGAMAADLLLTPFLETPFVAQTAWLNDIVVNNYFNYLTIAYPSEKIEAILSLELGNDNYDICAKLSKPKRSNEKQRLQEAQIILCPFNVAGVHWYLLIIEKKPDNLFSITTLDGLNNTSMHPALWQKAQALIEFLHPHALKEEGIIAKSSRKVPSQQNDYDCGTVICYFAKHYCENKKQGRVFFMQSHYTPFRLEIARALCSQDKAVFFDFGRQKNKLNSEKREEFKQDLNLKPPLCLKS